MTTTFNSNENLAASVMYRIHLEEQKMHEANGALKAAAKASEWKRYWLDRTYVEQAAFRRTAASRARRAARATK